MQVKDEVAQQKVIAFEIGGDVIMRYQSRLCVPNVDGLGVRILIEAHKSNYTIHPYSTNIYYDLKKNLLME